MRRNHVPIYEKKPPLEFLERTEQPDSGVAPALISSALADGSDAGNGAPSDEGAALGAAAISAVVVACLIAVVCAGCLCLQLWRRAGRPQVIRRSKAVALAGRGQPASAEAQSEPTRCSSDARAGNSSGAQQTSRAAAEASASHGSLSAYSSDMPSVDVIDIID